MTSQEIISFFELKVDDSTELSTSEELALLNAAYQFVCADRDWEFLKTEASGTMATTTTITLPSNFSHIVENLNYTNNAISTEINQKPIGILINGTKWITIVNWSDRRQYANKDGYAYVDIANGTIVFTYPQPSGATYSFDYKKVPADLGLSDSPAFPARFHRMLAYAMAVDDMATQLFDKNRSYANENQVQYIRYFQQLCSWNASLQNY